MRSVQALAPHPVPEAVAVDAARRYRWDVLGSDAHPVASALRAGPTGTLAPSAATAVLLGGEFRPGDNALLLDGLHAARRQGGRLVLIHLGAGGTSLLRAA